MGTHAAVAYFGTAVSFRHRFAQYDMVQLFSEVSGKEQRELLRFLYREVGKPLRRVKNGIKKKVFYLAIYVVFRTKRKNFDLE